MRWWILAFCVMGAAGAASRLEAATAKIIKVLPHYVDQAGRISLSPSLFERDAYQALLRRDRSLCSGFRFDVHYRARSTRAADLKLRFELATTTAPKDRPITVEQPLKRGGLCGRWTQLALAPEVFGQVGELVAWRATVWDGAQLLAEQSSFLW